MLEVPYVANHLLLRERRQRLIDYNVVRENRKRYKHDYQVNDEVLEIVPKEHRARLAATCKGPYRINRVHTNGTITIERSPEVLERVSIRNFKPYRRTAWRITAWSFSRSIRATVFSSIMVNIEVEEEDDSICVSIVFLEAEWSTYERLTDLIGPTWRRRFSDVVKMNLSK